MKRIIFGSLLFALPLIAELEPRPTLHVNGIGKVAIKATLADIRLGVEVEGKKSIDVQNQLSEALNRLNLGLKKASPDKLETSSFTVHPEYNDQTPRQIKGYRGVGEILVTTTTKRAGEVIGVAMDSGATKVNGIDLRASKDEIKQASQQAIKEACAAALASAQTAFEALNLTFDEIIDVNLTPQEPVYRSFRASMAFNDMEKGSTGPQIEGEQVIQSDIGLQIRFKN